MSPDENPIPDLSGRGFSLHAIARGGGACGALLFSGSDPASAVLIEVRCDADELWELRIADAGAYRFANFQGLTHSYNLSETDLSAAELAARSSILGPILALSDNQQSIALAYEHGSTVPDAYLRYTVRNLRLHLSAAKGNVYPGRPIDAAHSWQSVWFEAGAVAGPIDALAPVFRRFVLNGIAPHSDTRKPLIF